MFKPKTTPPVNIFAPFDGLIDKLKAAAISPIPTLVSATATSPNEGASIAVTTSEAPVSSKPSSKRKANDDPATPNQDDVAESKFTEEEAMNTKKLKNDDSKRESARICLTQTVEVMRSALLHSDTTSLRQSAQISSCQSEDRQGFEYDRMSCLVDCMGTLLEYNHDVWEHHDGCRGMARALGVVSRREVDVSSCIGSSSASLVGYAEKQENLYRLMRHNVAGSEYRYELKDNPEEVMRRGEPTHLRDVVRYLFRSQKCDDIALWHAQPTDKVYAEPSPVRIEEDDAYSCAGHCVAQPFAVRSTFQCVGCDFQFSHPRAAIAMLCNHETAQPFDQVLRNSLNNLQPMPKCPRRREESAQKHVVGFTDPHAHTFSDLVCLDFTAFEYARDFPEHEFPVAAPELAAGFFNAANTSHYSPIGFVYNVKDTSDDSDGEPKDPAHYVADILVSPGCWMQYDDMKQSETARYTQPSFIHTPTDDEYALRNIALALYRRDIPTQTSNPSSTSLLQFASPTTVLPLSPPPPPSPFTLSAATSSFSSPSFSPPFFSPPSFSSPSAITSPSSAITSTLLTSLSAPALPLSIPTTPLSLAPAQSTSQSSVSFARRASVSPTVRHISPPSAFRTLPVSASHSSSMEHGNGSHTVANVSGKSALSTSRLTSDPFGTPLLGSRLSNEMIGSANKPSVNIGRSEEKSDVKTERRSLPKSEPSDGRVRDECGGNGNSGGGGGGGGGGVGDPKNVVREGCDDSGVDDEVLKNSDEIEWYERRERKRTADMMKSMMEERAERNADFKHVKSKNEALKAQRSVLMRSEMETQAQIGRFGKAVAELEAKLLQSNEVNVRLIASEKTQQEVHSRTLLAAERKYADMVSQYTQVIDNYRNATEVFKNDCEKKLQAKQQDVIARDEYIVELDARINELEIQLGPIPPILSPIVPTNQHS